MEKSKIRKNKRIKIFAASLLAIIAFAVAFLIISYFRIDYSFDEELFLSARKSGNAKIYYDAEKAADDLDNYVPKLYEEVSCDGFKRLWTPYGEISETVKNAFIAMEDREFFSHGGVNLKRTASALLNYFFRFKSNFGGSTITQQVVKNISGDSERTVSRKFNEILRAVHIEGGHTKEEIFEVYLNIVGMSENIIGVGEAAELYFGKSAGELDYTEAAVIVGIANAPGRYNPYRNPEACLEKRNKVLFSLKSCGYISEDYYNKAIQTELGVLPKAKSRERYNSWFSECVLNEAAEDLAKEKSISKSVALKYILNGGISVYSTVSPDVQKIMEEYFENPENFPESVSEGLQYSMIISSPRNGNLLGIIGSYGEKNGNRLLNYAEVNVTPGSSLKPIALYAPLLDAGKINWASVFDDVPVDFVKESDDTWRMFPQNYPAVYDGLTCIKDALRFSKNTVAVRLFNMLGAERIYLNLKNDFGFDSLVKRRVHDNGSVLSDLSASPLALGQLTDGVSLRRLTEAYNVFPNDGRLSNGKSYLAVFDSEGRLILEKRVSEKTVFSTDSARIMNKLLECVADDGTAKKITLKEIVDTAGKTGTSGGDRDRLFVGYTPELTAGIWCGYTGEKREIGYQSKSHLEIWDELIKLLYQRELFDAEKHFSVEGLEKLPYCMDSGELYSDTCMYDPRGLRMDYGYFSAKNKPTELCRTHHLCKYDLLTGGVATDGCDGENITDVALIRNENRSFPCEIIITDAEYVYRDMKNIGEYPRDYTVPFFICAVPEGEYVGRSRGKKQFNSVCYLHID